MNIKDKKRIREYSWKVETGNIVNISLFCKLFS